MSTASPGLSRLLPASSSLPYGERHRVPTGDGGQLHAVVAGAGRPLVLTHGALLSLEAWALLWQPLLAGGHQIIAYDLRGHGRSPWDGPASASRPTPRTWPRCWTTPRIPLT